MVGEGYVYWLELILGDGNEKYGLHHECFIADIDRSKSLILRQYQHYYKLGRYFAKGQSLRNQNIECMRVMCVSVMDDTEPKCIKRGTPTVNHQQNYTY